MTKIGKYIGINHEGFTVASDDDLDKLKEKLRSHQEINLHPFFRIKEVRLLDVEDYDPNDYDLKGIKVKKCKY